MALMCIHGNAECTGCMMCYPDEPALPSLSTKVRRRRKEACITETKRIGRRKQK